MIGMYLKFCEAKFIRTIFLVDINLGKEPDFIGFEGKF